MTNHLRHISPAALACGVLLIGAATVNQSAVHWRTDLSDSHLFAYYGWCVAGGARPYLDVWDNKPPGLWWVNAAAFRLCGPGLGGDVLLGSLALGITLIAFVGVARTAFNRSLLLPAAVVGAILLTDLRFECGSNRTETFVAACETLVVLGYLRWLRRGRLAWLALAGLAAGAAPLFKQAGVAAAAACAVHLVWVQSRRVQARGGWQPWFAAAVGAAAAPLVALAVLAGQGALGAAAFAVGTFNRAYFAVDDATWIHIDRALRVYQPVLALLSPVCLIAGTGLAWGLASAVSRKRTGTPRPPPRRGIGVLGLWFLLAAYLACVGPGRRGYHLMPVLPALGLLALYPLHLLAGRRGLWARLTARPGAAGVLVVWAYLLGTVAVGSLAEAGRIWQTKPHWYALHTRAPAPYELQAAEIDRLTKPADTIYVWGWSPGTYRYSYRRPASRFATIEKLSHLQEHARFIIEGAIADIRRSPPQIFVIAQTDYAAMAGPADEFGTWLRTCYENVRTIEGMTVLIRRASPP